jgi:hypothetical protein
MGNSLLEYLLFAVHVILFWTMLSGIHFVINGTLPSTLDEQDIAMNY